MSNFNNCSNVPNLPHHNPPTSFHTQDLHPFPFTKWVLHILRYILHMFLRFIICITYQILHTAPTCIKCNLCWYLIVTKLCSKKVMETELSFYRLSDMCKKTSHSWNWPIYYYKPQQYPNQWLSQIGKQLSGKFFSGDDSCQQKNMLTFGQEVDQTQAAITTTSNPTPQSEAPSFPWIHPQSIFDTPLPHPLRCTPLKLVMNPPPQKKYSFYWGIRGPLLHWIHP